MATVTDTFSRTRTNGWGTADEGGTWDNTGAAWSTNGSLGLIDPANASPINSIVGDGQHASRHVRGLVKWRLSRLPGSHTYLFQTYSRRTPDYSPDAGQYTHEVTVRTGGQIDIQHKKQVGGVETAITGGVVSTGKTYVALDWWWLRWECVGVNPTNLRMRLWKDGDTEPGAWDLDETDATDHETGGTTGIRVEGTGAAVYPLQYAFDDLSFTTDAEARGTRVPTFTGAVAGYRQVGVNGVNQNLFTVFNKVGSGVLVAVRRLTLQFDQTVQTAAVVRVQRTTRITDPPSDGTLLTPVAWDTSQTHNTSVEIRGRASADGTNGTFTATAVPYNARLVFDVRMHTTIGQHLAPDTDLLPDFPYPEDPLVLREGEGVLISSIGAQATGTSYLVNAMIEEFTYAAGGTTFTRTLAESVETLTEAVARASGSFPRSGADALASLSEAVSRAAASWPRTLAQSLGALTEAVTRTPVLNRSTTETFGALTEAVTRAAASFPRSVAQTLGAVSEAVTRGAGTFTRTGADTLGAISEAVTRTPVLSRSTSDALATLTEAVTRGASSFTRSVAQTLGAVSEAATRAVGAFTRSLADSLGTLTEVVTRVPVVNRTTAQTLGALSEAVTRDAMAVARSTSQALGAVTEAVTRGAVNVARSLADSLATLTEAVVGVPSSGGPIVRSVADAIASLSEAVIRTVNPSRTTSQTLGAVSESVSRGAIAFARTISQSLGALSEAVSRAPATFTRLMAESIGAISEVVTRSGSWPRTVAQSLGAISEAVTRTPVFNRSASQTLGTITETVSVGTQTVIRTVAQTLGAILEAVTTFVVGIPGNASGTAADQGGANAALSRSQASGSVSSAASSGIASNSGASGSIRSGTAEGDLE